MKKKHKIFWIAIASSLIITALIPVASALFYTLDELIIDEQEAQSIMDDEAAEGETPKVSDYFWYEWKLPIVNGELRNGISRNFYIAAQLSAWLLYLIHQLITWIFIYKLAKSKVTGRLNRWNYALLLSSFGFAILHIIQTALYYEGLAQQVPIFTSQGSVIIMLVFFLLLLNKKRGLFFGRKVPFPARIREIAVTSHPYIISWAIIYTFWYHPAEITIGHLTGFFYTFLLITQMSFAGTSIHSNRYWIVFLELFVLFHAVTVALFSNTSGWIMFASGFGLIFVVTQLYGLKLKRHWNITVTAGYLIAIALLYSGLFPGARTPLQIHEIFYIAFIEYLLVFFFALIMLIASRFKKKRIQSDNR